MAEEIKDLQKEQEINEVQKKINEVLNLGEIEDLIKSNEKIFEVNNITYRVRKPTFKQRQEAYKKRIEKFTELLQNDKYVLESDLKTSYLKRNIDIDAMTRSIQNKMNNRDSLMLKLGEMIKNKVAENELETVKNEVQALNKEIQRLSIQKTNLLEFCIENQVAIYTYSYLTFLLAEKKEGDNWVRVWNTWEEFENEKEGLINRFSYYVTMMSGWEEM